MNFTMYFIVFCFFLGFIIGSTIGLRSFFKRRKFRKHIRECGILDDLNIQSYGISYYDYTRKGLYDVEKKILKEEIKRVEWIKNRKEFLDKWF